MENSEGKFKLQNSDIRICDALVFERKEKNCNDGSPLPTRRSNVSSMKLHVEPQSRKRAHQVSIRPPFRMEGAKPKFR